MKDNSREIIAKLEKKGYREYRPTQFDKDVEKCWQKRFDDDTGKKYFIDAKMYPSWTHPHTGEITPPGFEYEVYFTCGEDERPVRMLFYARGKAFPER